MPPSNNTIRIVFAYTKSFLYQPHCTLTGHYSEMEVNKIEVYEGANYLLFLAVLFIK